MSELSLSEFGDGKCELCEKPTRMMRGGYSRFCGGGCRGKWYRWRTTILETNKLIEENRIDEIDLNIRQLRILGYEITIKPVVEK